MKTKLFFLSAFGAAAFVFASCEKEPFEEPVPVPVAVTGVALQPSLMLGEGGGRWLSVVVLPADASNREVAWTSDNPDIATVDPVSGKVTGVSGGTATVTAMTLDGGMTASCTVTVIPRNEAVATDDILPLIVDPGFRSFCLRAMKAGVNVFGQDPPWDSDGDGKLSSVEASNVRLIHVWHYSNDETKIASLDGLEYFTGLISIYIQNCDIEILDLSGREYLQNVECRYNRLRVLDVSGCGRLERLSCSDNELTSIDVSDSPLLRTLGCGYNPGIVSVDVSGMKHLTDLVCGGDELLSVDASDCSALTDLSVYGSPKLASLNVAGCVAIDRLTCDGSVLTSLDVSDCREMTGLTCRYGALTSLDLSANLKLRWVGCGNNRLASLNVSMLTRLESLSCDANVLTSLNVTKNISLYELGCSDNLLKSLDISKNRQLGYLVCDGNPGINGKFSVLSWFDNKSVPTAPPRNPYDIMPVLIWPFFTTGSWNYNGETVSVSYVRI